MTVPIVSQKSISFYRFRKLDPLFSPIHLGWLSQLIVPLTGSPSRFTNTPILPDSSPVKLANRNSGSPGKTAMAGFTSAGASGDACEIGRTSSRCGPRRSTMQYLEGSEMQSVAFERTACVGVSGTGTSYEENISLNLTSASTSNSLLKIRVLHRDDKDLSLYASLRTSRCLAP